MLFGAPSTIFDILQWDTTWPELSVTEVVKLRPDYFSDRSTGCPSSSDSDIDVQDALFLNAIKPEGPDPASCSAHPLRSTTTLLLSATRIQTEFS